MMEMKNKQRNNVVRYMNSVNKNAVHKNLKQQAEDDNQFHVNKELDEYYKEFSTLDDTITSSEEHSILASINNN